MQIRLFEAADEMRCSYKEAKATPVEEILLALEYRQLKKDLESGKNSARRSRYGDTPPS